MADGVASRPTPHSDPQDRAVPLLVSLTSRDGTLSKDGRIYNGYIEDKQTKRIRRRPGLSVAVSALGVGQGLSVAGNSLIIVAGSTVYRATWTWTQQTYNVPSVTGAGWVLGYGGYVYFVHQSGVARSSFGNSLSFSALTTSGYPGATNVYGATVFDGKMWVLANRGADKGVWYSTNGTTWTDTGASLSTVGGLASNGTSLLALTNNAIGNGETYVTSTDGTTFSAPAAMTGPGTSVANFAFGSHGSNFWAIGGAQGASNFDGALSSPTGSAWTTINASAGVATGTNNSGTVASLRGYMYVFGAGGTKLYASLNGGTFTQFATTTGLGSLTWTLSTLGNTLLFGGNAVAGFFRQTATISSSSAGTVSIPTNEQVDMVQDTGGHQLMIKGTGIGYVMDLGTNAITQITDADYPATTVRGIAYLDGTFYVMDPDGTIWGSDIDDPTSWSALNFISAEDEPDGGVCIAKYLNYVVAFGQWTVQFFWDAANATGSPLSAVQNSTMQIGCAHGNSVAQIESTLLWLAQRKGSGSTAQKGRFIAMLNGTNYVQVSSPDVDRILDADDLATVYSSTLAINGHAFYLLSLGTTGVTLVFDMSMQVWYVWTRRTASSPKTITSLTQSNGLATATATSHGFSDGDFVVISGATQSGYNLSIPITYVDANTFTYPVASATVSPATGSPVATGSSESYFDMAASVNFDGTPVMLDAGTGAVWTVGPTTYADNSQPIDFRIRTNNVDQGNNERKFVSSVAAITDLTTSAQTGLLRNSDDDFQTWSTFRRYDLSQTRANAQRWGNYRRRAWEWRFNGTATDHRIEALEAEIEQGNS